MHDLRKMPQKRKNKQIGGTFFAEADYTNPQKNDKTTIKIQLLN